MSEEEKIALRKKEIIKKRLPIINSPDISQDKS